MKQNTANADIRARLKKNNIRMWQLADELKISPTTLTCRLRHELSDKEKNNIFAAIICIEESRHD